MTDELSGDGRLTPANRLRWLAINAVRNLRGAFARVPTETARPGPDVVKAARGWAGSPSRLVSDEVVRIELARLFGGRHVTIVDIGCGGGGARRHFEAAGLTGDYLGIDIDDRFDRRGVWPGLASRFVKADAHDVQLPDCDLVFSLSALEHIPDDARLIVRLRAALKPGGAQIHVVPAEGALVAYLWHGYRQYSRLALARRFDLSRTRVIEVGGLASLALHATWIALPEIILGCSLRRALPGLYGRLVAASIGLDRFLPFGPTNYVVIERAPGS